MERFIDWASKSPELIPDSCPWGLADDSFPLGEAVLLKAQKEHKGSKSFLRTVADKWYENLDCVIPGSDESPGQLFVHTPCCELASTCLTKCGHPVDIVEQFVDFLEMVVLRSGATQYDEHVLRFSPRFGVKSPHRFVLASVYSYLKKSRTSRAILASWNDVAEVR